MRRALLLAAVALLGAGCSHGGRPGVAARPGGLLFARDVRSDRLVRIDVRSGRTRVVRVRGLAGGDPIVNLAAVGSRLVYYGRTHTYAIGPSLRGRPLDLGRSWYFVPAAGGGRVWLAELDPASPPTVRALAAVREVSLDGAVVARSRRRPPSGALVAATAAGPLFQRRRGLALWDVEQGSVVARIPGSFPVAVHGDTVASCGSGCLGIRLTDVRTGAARVVRPPAGHRFEETYDGAFSPDGRLLAVPATRRDGHGVALIEPGRPPRMLPGPPLAPFYWSLAWSPSGRWLFFVATRGRIEAYDTRTGRLNTLRARLTRPAIDLVSLPD
jgi:hypothetical protein